MKFFLMLIFVLSSCSNISPLQSKYPMKLLSNDHGILTEEDMYDKGFQVKIEEFGTEPSSEPRWICFETINFKSKCIDVGYSEELKENSADLDFVVKQEGKELRLDFNSIVSNDTCEEHRSTWKKIMTGEKYFCVSATMLAIDQKDANKISGFFRRLKTKKGCDSWFEGDCK